MNLLEIQHRMLEAVMQPLTAGEQMQSRTRDGKSMHEVAAEFIKPNDRLSSFERLEIYNRQYWFRILAALDEDFRGLRAIVGQRRFEALSKAYLVDCPSESFTLRNLGSRLEWWLRSHPEWIQPRATLALDMVRLEWAEIEAFDGTAEPPLVPGDLLASDPDPQFRLQPYLQLLRLRYPVDDLLVAIRKDNSESAMASNAVSQHHRRNRVRKVARQKPQAVHLAVHRLDYSVYFKRIEPEAFTFLSAIRQGKSLSDAAVLAFQRSDVPETKLLGIVQNWFEHWSTLGWFCQSKSANPEFISLSGRQS
jgi:Putative DNA-binding domain